MDENKSVSFGKQVALNALWDTMPQHLRYNPSKEEIQYFDEITACVNEVIAQYSLGTFKNDGSIHTYKLRSQIPSDFSMQPSDVADVIANEILIGQNRPQVYQIMPTVAFNGKTSLLLSVKE